jgi:hypothetical protein
VLLGPFFPSTRLVYAVVIPSLWIHWMANDDGCVLTMLESHLRGVEKTSTFMHRLVSPVYSISENSLKTLSWIVTIALWAYCVTKIRRVRSNASPHATHGEGERGQVFQGA